MIDDPFFLDKRFHKVDDFCVRMGQSTFLFAKGRPQVNYAVSVTGEASYLNGEEKREKEAKCQVNNRPH